jgi:hypothetical protein
VALRWRSFDSYGRPTCATKSAQPQRHGGQLNGQVAARANINSAHSAKWRFVALRGIKESAAQAFFLPFLSQAVFFFKGKTRFFACCSPLCRYWLIRVISD